ncbi:hypothetical protein Sa4125_39050 [Aureimonas sp. SA4125]|nr:hypothetical protein Sa4125_39050 [Aureimonas sp. SA4125]
MGVVSYAGDLHAALPRQKRQVLFCKGEITSAIPRQLRTADGPMRCREIATAIVAMNGMDGRDRRYMKEVSDRVSKALRAQREKGLVTIRNVGLCPIRYSLDSVGRGTSEGQ